MTFTRACQEISINFYWLRPICELVPDRVSRLECGVGFTEVPSGFYLADSLIWLDHLMKGMLLQPYVEETKRDIAGREAKRLKRLVGALRHLYRNCPFAQTWSW